MEKGSGGSFMQKVAAVIVDRKTFFFLLFAVLAVFCVFSRNWVNVNDDITSYLAKDTETRRGKAGAEDRRHRRRPLRGV